MDSRATRVARNTLYLLLEKGMVIGATFGIFVLVARHLGQGGLGQYTFSLGLVSFFGVFTDLGMNIRVTRGVARAPRQAGVYVSTVVPLKGVLGLVVLAVLLLIVASSGYSPEISRAVPLFAVALALNGIGTTVNSIFKGLQRMGRSTLITGAVQTVLFAGCALMVYCRLGLLGVAWGYAAARLFHVIFAGGLYRSLSPGGGRAFDVRLALHLSKTTIFSLPAAYFLLNLLNLSAVALFHARGDTEVGAFGAASRLCAGLLVFAISFSEALFPMIAREFRSAPESARVAYERSARYFVVLMIPVLAATVLFAGQILCTVYGPEYRGSLWTLRVLLGFVPVATLCTLCHCVLVAAGRERFGFWTLCTAVVLGFPVILYLSARIGHVGAAVACLALACVLFFVLYVYIRKRVFPPDPKKGLIKPIACGIFMGLSMYLSHSAGALVTLAVGATTYTVLLWATRTLSPEDLRLFWEILRSPR